MNGPQTRAEERPGATFAQLRGDIDSGLTGEKSGGFDPAAAPLGTDDEAAGARAAPDMIARERACARLGAGDSAAANAATPELPPDGCLPPQGGLLLAALTGVALAAALGLVLFTAL
jgi:hypothetical protein